MTSTKAALTCRASTTPFTVGKGSTLDCGSRAGNHVRPHRSLAKKTPAEYLYRYHPWAAPKAHLSHMS
jgi:hypothetical protein